MPDLNPPSTPAAPHAAVLADTGSRWHEDLDFALGCECADPALQIERWMQEALPAAGDAH